MADEQPTAGDEGRADDVSSSDAPEAPAESGGTEEVTPVPAEEPAAPVAAEEPAAPAEEPAPAAAEEPAPAAAEEPAPAEPPAAAEEPAPAVAEEPAPAEPPAAADEEPAPAAAEAAAPDQPEAAAPDQPEAATQPAEPRRQRPPRRAGEEEPVEEAVVPGAHLEPDLVLEEKRPPSEGEFDPYADPAAVAADDDAPVAEGEDAAVVEEVPAPAARTPLDLAADARYRATGKRKRAIARVILKPGAGTYSINGKELDTYFPRVTLQKNARLPLETAGYESRMDVVAKIHGGGVSSQAIALRHGIARALVEADPNLRSELKRHGFLTRDARVKERKKAGLKKARKRPQFSKR
jgi:small subunit ribosomal protein S9